MKTRTLMIGALATLATVAAPMAASAQHWRGDRDRDGRYERWERRADHNRYDGGRYTRNERYNDWRRGQRDQYRDHRRYYRGATLPYEYRSRWYVRDYNRYGYGPPPRGYGYYRTDTGDIVLAVLATGVIISLLNQGQGPSGVIRAGFFPAGDGTVLWVDRLFRKGDVMTRTRPAVPAAESNARGTDA